MIDKRKKGMNWAVANNEGKTLSWDEVQVAVLMDLRDELQAMKGVLFAVSNKLSVLQCPNFLAIPHTLKRISRNTAKRKKPRALGKPKLRVVR